MNRPDAYTLGLIFSNLDSRIWFEILRGLEFTEVDKEFLKSIERPS